MGSVEFSIGTYTWEVEILSGPDVPRLFVGVGTPATRTRGSTPYGETAVGWDCQARSIEGAIVVTLDDVSRPTVKDAIGIRLDASHATLTFYMNGRFIKECDISVLGVGPFIPVVGVWGGMKIRLRASQF